MDVQRIMHTLLPRVFSLGLLSLSFSIGGVSWARADEAIASDAETNSTIFVSDESAIATDASDSQQTSSPAAQSAAGSLVFIEDTPDTETPPKTASTVQPTFMQPSASSLPATPQSLPSTIAQPVAKPVVREQPGDIRIAVHADAGTASASSTDAEDWSMEELLIAAHQLSQHAETDADYSQIIQACSEAMRHGPAGEQLDFTTKLLSWSYNRRGQLRADAGNADAASADFISALNNNSRNWRAMHNRGVSFAQTSQYADAFDCFNSVIQLNPRYAKAYANRATLYVQAKDLQSAVKDYQRAISLDSQFATAHVGLGRVYHMLGKWDEAVSHFSAAVELKPTSPEIVCSRGDLQADRGNYADALADYARTIELNPEFAHAYRNGAWLLATCPDERFRDPENAVLGARQAIEYSYGEKHVALDTLAAALASNGQYQEAIATETKAVDLAPESAKYTYLSRLQLYQTNQPFHTEPVGDVAQVIYESNDE